MSASTIVIPFAGRLPLDWLRRWLPVWASAGVRKVLLVGPADQGRLPSEPAPVEHIATGQPYSGEVWNEVLARATGEALLCVNGDACVQIEGANIHRLVGVVQDTGASLVYGHHLEETPEGFREHATIDYQLGSLREGFDFGPVLAMHRSALGEIEERYGPLADTRHGALYDLRLRLSVLSLPVRLPEILCTCKRVDHRPTGQQIFDYVDPTNREAQIEMELLAIDHLERIGAKLTGPFRSVPRSAGRFPVEASVIIPVRNRERTIADAVKSVMNQKTDFAFNVIVVDNHSTDGTTAKLRALAAEDTRVVHLIPERSDLQIGGCWNLAVQSRSCGRIAAQLDSDDLYADDNTLQILVNKMNQGPYAMVVGSYRLVNYDLREIPPGLIDHREWTRENGRNNALRVNGFGAPRVFDTALLRAHPLPNVSYGEDYAAGLRICREYEVGRLFEPIYLCRRWEGNTDANLELAVKNRHDTYKDRVRTLEILARQRCNSEAGA